MRDHDEVIKYVLQRAEEIKREEENISAIQSKSFIILLTKLKDLIIK